MAKLQSLKNSIFSALAAGVLAISLLAVPAYAQTMNQLLRYAGQLSAADKQKLQQQINPATEQYRPPTQNQIQQQYPLTPPSRIKTSPEPIAGFETLEDLHPFGSSLMEAAQDESTRGFSQGFSQLLDIPVPGNYSIGPGDVIELQLFGKENFNYSLRVDREGSINLPDIGPLSLSGMTFENASKAILERIAKRKIGVEASVTMGALRSIQIFMAGDVNSPGLYTTHALTTVTNALINSGGIRPTGSMRKIQLRRANRTVSQLDLYDILLRGDTRGDQRLQPGDVIFVPPVGPRAAIESGVNRPAIYELAKESTLADLVSLAGGMLPTAFPAESIVKRAMPDGSRQLIQVSLAETSGKRMKVHDGDIIAIPATLPRLDASVKISGAVEREGEYAWQPGMRVNDYLAAAAPKREAWLLLGFIGRTSPLSGAVRYLPFNPGSALAGQAGPLLEAGDDLILIDRETVDYLDSANVQFILAGQLPPKQLLEGKRGLLATKNDSLAGQARTESTVISDSASSDAVENDKANSSLKNNQEDGQVSYTCPGLIELAGIVHQEGSARFRSALLGATLENSEERLLKSQPCPSVIDKHPRLLAAILENTVTIRGEVRSPGLLPSAPGIGMALLIEAVGGLTRESDKQNIELLRQDYQAEAGNAIKRQVLSVEQLATESLQAGDMILVPKRYSQQDSGSIRIAGEVLRPGIYDIRRGERLSEVIIRAGGLSDYAYPFGAVFQRPQVKEAKRVFYQRAGIEMQNAVLMMLARQRRTSGGGGDASTFAAMRGLADELKNIEPSGRIVVEADPAILQVKPELDIVLEPGDSILIPKRPSYVIVMGEVLNPGALQFISGNQAEDYIASAGGAAETGDESRTYLILPNGNAEPLEVASWNAQSTPIPPGSVIYVPRDPLPYDSITILQTTLEIAKDVALTAASLNSLSK